MIQKKTNSGNKSGGIGSSVAIVGALAGAALGAYYLYGEKNKNNRKVVKGWMLKAKGEVLEQIEKVKELDKSAYEKIVTAVSDKYSKMKSVDLSQAAALASELKSHWGKVKRDFSKKHTPSKNTTKSVKKKPAKKTLKK